MAEITRLRTGKALLWAGRIIVFLVLIFSVLLIVWNISMALNLWIVIILGITLLALAGLIVSRWKIPIASIMLLLNSIILSIMTFYTHQILLWTIIGLPYLVVSLLFFISWMLSNEKQ
jgi:hypothetical protein